MQATFRTLTTRSLAAALVLAAGLATGYLAGQVTQPPPVLAAACQVAHASCGGGDSTRTAGAHVTHVDDTGASPVNVEPDTGESWNITAYWNTPGTVSCSEYTETATVTVDWLGSPTWWAITSESTTDNILDVSLCDPDERCTEGMGHGWGYTMIVDVQQSVSRPNGTYYLRQVVFTTTSVDDGNTLDHCSLDTAVSPTTQSFSVTDNGAFECNYDCSVAVPNITLTYE